jgi:hypothetical protein
LSKLEQASNNPGEVDGQTHERKNTEEILINNNIILQNHQEMGEIELEDKTET